MSKRTTFWAAWFTWILYLVIAIVTLLFQIKNEPSQLLNDIFDALILLIFATVGSLIASRRPQNPIAWLERHHFAAAAEEAERRPVRQLVLGSPIVGVQFHWFESKHVAIERDRSRSVLAHVTAEVHSGDLKRMAHDRSSD